MGLIVDVQKPWFGNTIDGNTNRRFFEDQLLASEIKGLDSQPESYFRINLKFINNC